MPEVEVEVVSCETSALTEAEKISKKLAPTSTEAEVPIVRASLWVVV